MNPLLKSLAYTVLCVGGPLALWLAFQLRPDLFVGKLKQVKWITGFFMVLMFFTLVGSFWLDRQQPPKPARIVPPPPVIKETILPAAPKSEKEGKDNSRRFFEIEDKR